MKIHISLYTCVMDIFIYSFIYEFNIYSISLNYRYRSIDHLQGSLHKDPDTTIFCQILFPIRKGKDHSFKGKNWIRRCSYSYKFGIWPTAPKNRARNQTGSWNWRKQVGFKRRPVDSTQKVVFSWM